MRVFWYRMRPTRGGQGRELRRSATTEFMIRPLPGNQMRIKRGNPHRLAIVPEQPADVKSPEGRLAGPARGTFRAHDSRIRREKTSEISFPRSDALSGKRCRSWRPGVTFSETDNKTVHDWAVARRTAPGIKGAPLIRGHWPESRGQPHRLETGIRIQSGGGLRARDLDS
jgi:hypothetical protein